MSDNICYSPVFIWLGAGEASNPYLYEVFSSRNSAGRAVLVEARDSAINILNRNFICREKSEIIKAVIDTSSSCKKFYYMDLENYSALEKPTGLLKLYPSLKVIEVEQLETVCIQTFIKSLKIDIRESNQIFLDIPAQNYELIVSLIEQESIFFFDEIHLSIGTFELYEASNSLQGVKSLLADYGYFSKKFIFDDPDMPLVSFKRSALCCSYLNVKEKNYELTKNIEKIHESTIDLVDIKKQVLKLKESFGNLNRESEIKSLICEMKGFVDKKLDSNKFSILDKIEKSSKNAIKQIESYYAVLDFFKNSEPPLEYHGWPISSDIAALLMNKIIFNNYDLVVEFGSGTSTVFFSKVIKNIEGSARKEKLGITSNIELNESEINFKKIISFEHDEKYYQKTYKALESQNLHESVDLVLAKLVDCEVQGKTYQYYNCEDKLNEIASYIEDRTANILVLIDGPPGATGPLARLPAIFYLLGSFGKHKLDLVLDDYNRKEEKEIVDIWKGYFNTMALEWEDEVIACEKGAWFCRING